MNQETGTRFTVVYRLQAASKQDAERFTENISLEQSVEMPLETVPESAKKSLPEILSVEQSDIDSWIARITYPESIIDGDTTQFLNVLFGNISLLKGIKILDVEGDIFNTLMTGPSFGISGIRDLLGIPDRPISCTALKPVGLSPAELADRTVDFSKGGMDIIKDDHGLANQSTASFKERVAANVRATRKGEQFSGKTSLYFPNITASPAEVSDRFSIAAELGADGVLISPQLTGLETVQKIAALSEIPVMAHPAFSGPYIIQSDYGFSMEFYYGKLWRALGADAVIYPNAGGRFTFTKENCVALNHQLRKPFSGFKSAFPVPAGGINLTSIPGLVEEYGNETIFLVGGSLYKQAGGIESATREFQQMLQQYE